MKLFVTLLSLCKILFDFFILRISFLLLDDGSSDPSFYSYWNTVPFKKYINKNNYTIDKNNYLGHKNTNRFLCILLHLDTWFSFVLIFFILIFFVFARLICLSILTFKRIKRGEKIVWTKFYLSCMWEKNARKLI